MNDLEGEQKTAVTDLLMGDRERARRGPGRKEESVPENLDEANLAQEYQRDVPHLDRKRHANPVADIFLQTGWAREPLGGMDDRGKAAAPRIEAGPDLAAGR